MKKRVIIFGTGGVAKSARDYYESHDYKVVAFTDNNKSNWNTYIEDIYVIPPTEIVEFEYDIIALGMFKHTDTVKKQLIEMGIDSYKIEIPIRQRKIYPCLHKYSDGELTEISEKDYNSKTNLEYNSWNIQISDEYFWDQLDILKKTVKNNNIPLSKICIVKGMCMVAHGCRPCKNNEDMDVIMTSDLRKLYGTGKIFVAGSIEAVPQHYMLGRDDDEIINDPERHIIVGGVKFMTLAEMYTYKREIRLIKAHDPGLRKELMLFDKFFKEHDTYYDFSQTQFADFLPLED